jgi:molybdenum cofactor guanylyltransferase
MTLPHQPEVAAYVLAGGASRRFGRDKALAQFGGQPMLARMLATVDQATFHAEPGGKIAVLGAADKYHAIWKVCVEDRWPGEGPLGGIVTALYYSKHNLSNCEWNLIVGCDMPFLTADWLRYLVQHTERSSAQVLLAHSAHGPEPLCACWRTDALETLREAFEQGMRRVTEGIALLRSEVLDEIHWKRFDSAGRLFWNMNTPTDYEDARQVVEAEQGRPAQTT